jgi:hypothetical protein
MYFSEGIDAKLKSVGLPSGDRLCHKHETSTITNNFSFRKTNGLRKPEIFYIIFDRYILTRPKLRPNSNVISTNQVQAQALPLGQVRLRPEGRARHLLQVMLKTMLKVEPETNRAKNLYTSIGINPTILM